jgi:beta-lactamase class A
MRLHRALTALALTALPHYILAQSTPRAILRERFAAELRAAAARFDGVLGAAVVDLTDGTRVGVNETLVFPQGSAIKVPILLELLRQGERRPALLRARQSVSAAARVGGTGVIGYFADGSSALSNEDLAVLMIVLSDNTATNLLIDAVSMDSVNATLRALGLRETKLQRKMMRPDASARGEENLSTPAEAVALMTRIARCELPVSAATCARLRHILELPKAEAVRAAIPDSIPVASKYGELDGVYNSWALVALPGRPFALAVMTSYGTQGEAAVREVARLALAYFSRLADVTPYGVRVPRSLLPADSATRRP